MGMNSEKPRARFLKIETVAKMTELSVETIRKWVKKGRIRTYRFGRAVRIRESDLLRFAEVRPSLHELRDKILTKEILTK